MDGRLSKFLKVIQDYLEHRWNLNFDVSRVADIACLIVEVFHGYGDRSSWIGLLDILMGKAFRFAKIVYLNGRCHFMRPLDITNRCIVRLINSCLDRPGHSIVTHAQIETEIDEEETIQNPQTSVDPRVMHILEKFISHRQFFKSLVRPIIFTDPGTIRLLTLMSWNNEQGSLALLECMQDHFQEMESYDGDHFVLTVNAFLDLAAVHDQYYPAKLNYLLFKGPQGLNPWMLIGVKIGPLLRWRLLYFLMCACEREEKMKEEMPAGREWDRVLDWMHRDSAAVPSIHSETWLDKQEITRWASQFADL